MTSPAIAVDNLGKLYHVSALQPGYKTWREGLNDLALSPIKLARSAARRNNREEPVPEPDARHIWAIRHVSFEVPFGQALGIVGHNGAGKSTLVKILSRITEPTEGRAVVAGRVGSLLEVSAGFHPELTGRENVYLNGAVLGMTRNEIRRRFDAIVEFAGVERYLDTPVKRYSSGMSMRLAFSVAAHLEPEVLVVDEVLAVGDSGFHQRCLDKMREAVTAGRTVLFISHNLSAVAQLCAQGLLLQRGRAVAHGTASEVVAEYLASGRGVEGRSIIESNGADEIPDLQFKAVSAAPIGKEASAQIDRDDGVEIVVEYEVSRTIENCQITLELWNYTGVCALSTGIRDSSPTEPSVQQPGYHVARCHIPGPFLRAGLYSLRLEAFVPDGSVLDRAPDALGFEVVDLSPPEAKVLEGDSAAVRPVLAWTMDE